VRAAPDEIKAFYNFCRHRNTPLVAGCKHGKEIKCPFHGWSWTLDGKLKDIPCRWDFPELKDEENGLVEVKVGTFNGFVFINMDPDAAPLEDYIPEELRKQLLTWPQKRRWKAVHVAHRVPCNWKLGMEAFLEVYHVPIIHPETVWYNGDYNTQYDFYGPHARMAFPLSAPSPSMRGTVEPQQCVDEILTGDTSFGGGLAEAMGSEYAVPQMEPGETLTDVRHKMADMLKKVYSMRTGKDMSGISDVEALDGIQYTIFPNLQPWGGYFYPAVYRWRPNGTDPESMIYEVMVLVDVPEDQPLPKDVEPTYTELGSQLTDAPGTKGAYGYLLDEDFDQLRRIQKNLHSDQVDHNIYANYQERNIVNFHNHLDAMLGK
jgi:nitrite reductase/ring-hydroxylating ferredoxin subunit